MTNKEFPAATPFEPAVKNVVVILPTYNNRENVTRFVTGLYQLYQLAGILPVMLNNYFLNAYWMFSKAAKVTLIPLPADASSVDSRS